MLIEQKTYDNLDMVSNSVPMEGLMDVSFLIYCQDYLLVEWLAILFFSAFILSVASYLFYSIRKNDRFKARAKRIAKKCFYLFIFTCLLYVFLIIIFGCNLYPL